VSQASWIGVGPIVYGALTGESAKREHPLPERLGIIGTGTIARGLAAVAARHGPVILLARSDASARAAQAVLDSEAVEVTLEHARLEQATYVVEAIVEDTAAKGELFARLRDVLGPETILATTTSSLSVAALAELSGRA
jgi:3-hydroxybutyryl-CoA dehydrogenase